jgi:antitoxin component YwqK of YwqJK toxin-antitoxin module
LKKKALDSIDNQIFRLISKVKRMRVMLLLFFGILFSVNLVAQEEYNQYDENNNRHGIWKKYYEGSDQLRYEGRFDHGKEVGTFKFYCSDCKEQPMVIKEFSKNDNTADVQFFTAKGKLVSEGKMNGKNRVGEWLFYHKKSNAVMSMEHYVDGKLHGKKLTYFPNGAITEEISYENGVMQGDNLYYSPEGTLLKKLRYSNDELHGEATYYDAYGNVTIKGYYKNGKKHGLWQYFKDGKVEIEETFPKPKNNN